MDLNISPLARHGPNIANFLTIHKIFHISQSSRPALYTAAFTVLRVYRKFGCSVWFTLVSSVRLQGAVLCAAMKMLCAILCAAMQIPNFCVGL